MASSGIFRLAFLLTLSWSGSVFAGVPVLMWESSRMSNKVDSIPALHQLDGDEFANHLAKTIRTHKPLIVVFVEETLSVEDFSWKDDTRRGAFPKLDNTTGMSAKVEFIPSVLNPIGALKDLLHSQGYAYQKFNRANSKPGNAVEISLSDPLANEDRPQLLRRHDEDITRIYGDLLASSPNILSIFTGRQNSWVEAEENRVRRDVNGTERAIMWKTRDAMISASSAKLTANNKVYTLGAPLEIKSDERATFYRMIYTYSVDEGSETTKITLRLKFNFDKAAWNIGDSEVDVGTNSFGPLAPKVKNSTPLGKSLSAPQFVLENSATNTTLVFTGFQAEKFKDANQSSFSSAGTGGNQFFTGAIWMGILVTWTLLIILAWGITMLMDIKTMDRFDDPKGKTITVNVNE